MHKELINPGPSPYGWHRLQNALRCPRLARLEAAAKASGEPRDDSPALVKGSLVHLGLAHYYARLQCEQRGEDPDRFYDPHEAIAVGAIKGAAEGTDMWHEYAPVAQEVVEAYQQFWSVCQWEVLAVEQVLRADVEGYPYTQRADLIVGKQGKFYIVDHKTTGRVGRYSQERYILDGQFIGYEVLGQAIYGAKWGGVILNFIGLGDGKFHRSPAEMKPGAEESFRNTIIYGSEIIERFKDMPVDDVPAVFTGAFGCNTPYPRGDGKYRCVHFERCQYGA